MADGPATPFQWRPEWFDACVLARMTAWRGVESQSQIATLSLVDSRAEHDALEEMLEASKPPLPEDAVGLSYLLFTPFRYTSPYPSRFRRPHEAGIWYGADSVQTVCAETAYWRHRFVLDSSGLAKSGDAVLTRHTLFQARVKGRAFDLTASPWDAGRAIWTDGRRYESTHAVAVDARARGVAWIRYESVRQPGRRCAAVLSPRALASAAPFNFKEWACSATRSRVILTEVGGHDSYSWDF